MHRCGVAATFKAGLNYPSRQLVRPNTQ